MAILQIALAGLVLGALGIADTPQGVADEPIAPAPALEPEHRMTQGQLEQLVHDAAEDSEGGGGMVRMVYKNVAMACISDAGHDRMRIIAPVVNTEDAEAGQLLRALEANFHLTLDARYCTRGGVLYAAYIHPMSPLREGDVRAGLDQVAALVKNFGTTYSSDSLVFGAGEAE